MHAGSYRSKYIHVYSVIAGVEAIIKFCHYKLPETPHAVISVDTSRFTMGTWVAPLVRPRRLTMLAVTPLLIHHQGVLFSWQYEEGLRNYKIGT